MTVSNSMKPSTRPPKLRRLLSAALVCGSLALSGNVANGQSQEPPLPPPETAGRAEATTPDRDIFLQRMLNRTANGTDRPPLRETRQPSQDGYRVAFATAASASTAPNGRLFPEDSDGDTEQDYLPDFPRLESDASRGGDTNAEEQAEPEDAPDRVPQSGSRTFGTWPQKSIREVRIDPRDFGDQVPADSSASLFANVNASTSSIAATYKLFAWAAPDIRHQPLYFEDVSLERYGQTKGLIKQPFVSAGKFLADASLLPLRAYRDHPQTCDTPLGFCRPGASSNRCPCEQCPSNASGKCTSCR